MLLRHKHFLRIIINYFEKMKYQKKGDPDVPESESDDPDQNPQESRPLDKKTFGAVLHLMKL